MFFVVVLIASCKSEKSNQPLTCTDTVIELITSTQSYKEKTNGVLDNVLKNGGTSIGVMLESSPNPKRDGLDDFSETYDVVVYENYPDRIYKFARYSFNPKNNTLFEINSATLEQTAISFDKELVNNIKNTCK
jgi:hypothetical protein